MTEHLHISNIGQYSHQKIHLFPNEIPLRSDETPYQQLALLCVLDVNLWFLDDKLCPFSSLKYEHDVLGVTAVFIMHWWYLRETYESFFFFYTFIDDNIEIDSCWYIYQCWLL